MTGRGPMTRRLGPGDLALSFVLLGFATYLLLRFSYDSLPPLGVGIPLPLAALTLVEFIVARRVRLAVGHDPQAKAMTAIAVARCVALGKASALVGAGVAGAVLALLARVVPDVGTVRAATNDATVGGLLLGSAVLLVVAGLLLERAGIDPGKERERQDRVRDR